MTVYMYVYRCHTYCDDISYMRTWQACENICVRDKRVTLEAYVPSLWRHMRTWQNVYSYVSSMWKCMSTWQTCNISYAYVSIMWKYIQLDIFFTLNKDQIISWQKEPAFFSSNVTIISRWKLQGQIIHI